MKKILITGATGFVGIHLIEKIVDKNYSIRVFVKKKDIPDFEKNLEKIKKLDVEIVYGDLREKKSLLKVLEDIDIVVHLAAIIRSTNKKEFYDVNVKGTKNLIDACKANKIRRIIVTSTIAAYRPHKGCYGKTKEIADNLFLKADIDLTILIPPLIYGKGSQGFKKIIKYIKKFPFFILLIGSGNHLQQPAYVDDVVNAILNCIENDKSIGKSYWVGGKEAITFNKFIDVVCEGMEIRKIKIHTPVFICKIIAIIFERFGFNILTRREINSINQNTNIDNSKAIKEIRYNPISLDKAIYDIIKNES